MRRHWTADLSGFLLRFPVGQGEGGSIPPQSTTLFLFQPFFIMSQDTLQITKTAARAAYEQADSTFKPTLETLFGKENLLPVTERIKSWQDVLNYHGETEREFNERCTGLEPDEIGYRMCKMWCAALNEDWVADYDDTDQPKYHVWMEKKSSGFRFDGSVSYRQRSTVGSRLVLKSSELAQHYGKYASDSINNFFL